MQSVNKRRLMTFHANEVCSKINAAEEKLQETVTTDVSRWAQLVSHKSPRSKSGEMESHCGSGRLQTPRVGVSLKFD